MITLLSTVPVPYSSALDAGEPRTIFHLRRVTSLEMQVINDATVVPTVGAGGRATGASIKSNLRLRLLAKLGLVGWENGPVQFATTTASVFGLPERTVITDELLNQLPVNLVNELGEEVQNISVYDGEQVKN